MRRYVGIVIALIGTLALPVASFAADGIKATATASRKVPADVLAVSFHMIERSEPEQPSQLRAEELRIKEAIRASGAKIVSWTSKISLTNAGFSTTTFNFINSASKDSQAVDTRREIIVRLAGIKDAEPVAAILGRNGVRHGVMFTWTHSNADAVREELVAEATVAAVARARKLAELAGAKSGGILDLTTAAVSGTTAAVSEMSAMGMNIIRTTPVAADELIEDADGPALVIRASATVTLQSKID